MHSRVIVKWSNNNHNSNNNKSILYLFTWRTQQPRGQLQSQHEYNNNSIQFFIINVPNQQLQRQLQTQHSVHTGNKIKSNNNSITNINSIKAN
jgi:hypothetical protein